MIETFNPTVDFIKFISVKTLLRGVTFDVKLVGVNEFERCSRLGKDVPSYIKAGQNFWTYVHDDF
jgi:hypothetical protein